MRCFILILMMTPVLYPRQDVPGIDNTDKVVFQSKALHELTLAPFGTSFQIKDDEGEPVDVEARVDSDGILYWFRKLRTPVCLSGECKEIEVGIYWYCSGKFLGLEVFDEELTKTDHSIFAGQDYEKLVAVLEDEWSILREYEYSDLLNEEMEGVDGVSGATRREISEETVEGAVYTTYTLWHLINVGEKEQLRTLSADLINENKEWTRVFLAYPGYDYRAFLLELFMEGKLENSDDLSMLILDFLDSRDHISHRELAFKSLGKCDFDNVFFQEKLAGIFRDLPDREKMRVVNVVPSDSRMDKSLYQSLISALSLDDEWLAAKILYAVQNFPHQAPEATALAAKLTVSNNSYVSNVAKQFVKADASR